MRTNLAPAKTVYLFIISGVMIEGEQALAGSLVELFEADAKGLLARGKARVATDEDFAATGAAPEVEAESEAGAEPGTEDTGADTGEE